MRTIFMCLVAMAALACASTENKADPAPVETETPPAAPAETPPPADVEAPAADAAPEAPANP